MPGSVRTLDATPTRFDPDPVEDYQTSPGRVKRTSVPHLSSIELPPSPADSEFIMRQASPREESPSATTKEERRITRDINRGAPGDRAIFSEGKTEEQKNLAKRKSQYYGDIFAQREPITSARERISRESPILADVRTNVIVQDEYTFITDLSYALSTRFQRPENSIVVTLAHSCCLLFGGNFDPAYTLTINALQTQLQPVTNKRNAVLLAKAMEEGLGVGPERGLIKFCPIAEENMALSGRTLAQEIEDLEKENGESSNIGSTSMKEKRQSKRRQSTKSLRSLRKMSQPTMHEHSPTTSPDLSEHSAPPMPPVPSVLGAMDKRAEQAKKVGRRKSFIATIFGRAG